MHDNEVILLGLLFMLIIDNFVVLQHTAVGLSKFLFNCNAIVVLLVYVLCFYCAHACLF